MGMPEDGADTKNVDQLEEALLGSDHLRLPSSFAPTHCESHTSLRFHRTEPHHLPKCL